MSAYHLKIAKPAPPVRPEQNRLWKVAEKVPSNFFPPKLKHSFSSKSACPPPNNFDTLTFRVNSPWVLIKAKISPTQWSSLLSISPFCQHHSLRNVERFFGVSLKCNPVLVLQSFYRVALLIWTARSTDVKVWSSSHLPTMLYLEYNIQKVDGLREGFTKREWTARSTDVKVRSSSGKYLPMQSCIWNITKIKWSYVFSPRDSEIKYFHTHTHTIPMYNCWALWVVEFTSAIARKHFLIAFTPGRKHTATGKMGVKIGRNQFQQSRRKTKKWQNWRKNKVWFTALIRGKL